MTSHVWKTSSSSPNVHPEPSPTPHSTCWVTRCLPGGTPAGTAVNSLALCITDRRPALPVSLTGVQPVTMPPWPTEVSLGVASPWRLGLSICRLLSERVLVVRDRRRPFRNSTSAALCWTLLHVTSFGSIESRELRESKTRIWNWSTKQIRTKHTPEQSTNQARPTTGLTFSTGNRGGMGLMVFSPFHRRGRKCQCLGVSEGKGSSLSLRVPCLFW